MFGCVPTLDRAAISARTILSSLFPRSSSLFTTLAAQDFPLKLDLKAVAVAPLPSTVPSSKDFEAIRGRSTSSPDIRSEAQTKFSIYGFGYGHCTHNTLLLCSESFRDQSFLFGTREVTASALKLFLKIPAPHMTPVHDSRRLKCTCTWSGPLSCNKRCQAQARWTERKIQL